MTRKLVPACKPESSEFAWAISVILPVGEGVSELRIDYGPGYRVYLIRQGSEVVVLLGGGDKRTQDKDIKAAIKLAQGLQE